MEQVLDLYELPYDPSHPLICMDERPCQLIGDILVPIPMKPHQVKRQDYHYQRNGTASVFIAFEPAKGKRVTKVCKRRTKRDYALFMKQLKKNHYAKAEKIIVVQDNLNTHTPGSFYETFPAEEAFRLAQSFQMIYTPKKASWLNMAEFDLSAMSKQCLDRRIGSKTALAKEVKTWTQRRNKHKTKINWNFSKSKARNKFNRFYETIQN